MSKLFLIDQVQKAADISAFERKVRSIAATIGTSVDDLMLVMYFESKLNPAARNPYGSATGLLQFTDATAKYLGTSTNLLAAMSAEYQLTYVLKYLLPFKNRVSSLGDLYLAVFYPQSIGKPDSWKLPLSSQWVTANKIFDLNADGTITVGEIRKTLNDYKASIAKRFNYVLAVAGGGIALVILFASLLYWNS